MARLSNEVILKMSKLKTECYFLSTPKWVCPACFPITAALDIKKARPIWPGFRCFVVLNAKKLITLQ